MKRTVSVDELVERMARCRDIATEETRRKIGVILDLCEPYRKLGYSFTFDCSGDLNETVNRILVLLSDALLEDFKSNAAGEGGDGDDPSVMFAIGNRNGMTAQQRLDRHCARLRYVVEGWIAISFATGMDKRRTMDRIMRYLQNPFGMPEWADALRDKRYKASILAEGDLNRKPGLLNSITASVALVGEDIANTADSYAMISEMAESGAMRYGVRRGSTFPCPVCDAVCEKTYPVTQIVVPVHPRCMCRMYPVYD